MLHEQTNTHTGGKALHFKELPGRPLPNLQDCAEPVRLCEDRVAYEKSDGLRQEVENAVVFVSFTTTAWRTEKSGY